MSFRFSLRIRKSLRERTEIAAAGDQRLMKTSILKTTGAQRRGSIRKAAIWLRQGKLVAFPTETVYGLGADASNDRAVRQIFRVKGRPIDNPLIVHIWSTDQIPQLASSIPLMFWILAERFMPGPLTVLLRKSTSVPKIVTAGLSTVAIRMPDHAVAKALLKAAGVPIVAPSANLSGRPSPTTADHVCEDLCTRIPAILDGGRCRIGIESTVLDITRGTPVILRPGGISREEIEDALRIQVRVARLRRKRPSSPGMKYQHYAPRAELVVVEGEEPLVRSSMQEMVRRLHDRSQRVGIMAEESILRSIRSNLVYSLGSSGAKEATRRLFDGFRTLDRKKVDVILCQGFDEREIGVALMNRLRKAATRRVRV